MLLPKTSYLVSSLLTLQPLCLDRPTTGDLCNAILAQPGLSVYLVRQGQRLGFIVQRERCLGRIRRGPGVTIFSSLVWSRSIWWQGVWFCRLCLRSATSHGTVSALQEGVSSQSISGVAEHLDQTWLRWQRSYVNYMLSIASGISLLIPLLDPPSSYNYFYCTWADREIAYDIRFDTSWHDNDLPNLRTPKQNPRQPLRRVSMPSDDAIRGEKWRGSPAKHGIVENQDATINHILSTRDQPHKPQQSGRPWWHPRWLLSPSVCIMCCMMSWKVSGMNYAYGRFEVAARDH